jgi:nucleoside-diphosphate-sugar epimerase
LVEACTGVEAVIHLAAAKSGDLYAQFAATVVATENLLDAMTTANVKQIVLISSFAVYEYLHKRAWTTLDENSALDEAMVDRDDYGKTKLLQEQIVRRHAEQNGWRWTVLRPGMIFGRDNLFNARVGMAGARTWVRTGAFAPIPLTYVENCAEAIVLAAERPEAGGQILNIVDDDPPSQRKYAKLLAERTTPRPRIIPVPWTVMRAIARLAWMTNHWLLGGRAKVPGLLLPARVHARCKPLRFPNAKIRSVLGWSPRYGLVEALDRSSGPVTNPLDQVVTASPVEVVV